MTKPATKSAAITSPDLGQERLAQLKRLMPDLFDGEGNLDEAALRAITAPEGISSPERFRFEWAGKQQSKRQAFTPSKATLVADLDRSVEFDSTQNLIIEGDNLEVLKLLQTTYFERVKCIYIDPPYNTRNDFIYPDDFSETQKAYWQSNGTMKDGVKLTALPESHGRKHSLWLNMMQSRLLLARQLLREDGVIFISIDDNEGYNLRKLCDEVFGEGNFFAELAVIRSEGGGLAKRVIKGHDYALVYVKNEGVFKGIRKPKDIRGEIIEKDGKEYWIEEDWLRKEFGKYGTCEYDEIEKYKGKDKKIEIDDGIKEGIYQLIEKKDGRKIVGRLRLIEGDGSKFYSVLKHLNKNGIEDLENLKMDTLFDFPKPVSLVKELIAGATLFSKNQGDIILDFFAGSGTTAEAVLRQNTEDGGIRRYILVQVPEYIDEDHAAYKAGYKTISSLCIERVKRSGVKIRKENPDATVDTGFRVYRLADSNFPQNLYTADPEKSEAENLAALKAHLQAELPLASEGVFADIVTEIALKNGYGLFYTLERQSSFTANTVYRLHGNDKSALLCLDPTLADATVEALEPQSDKQLIVSRHALDTAKKWVLQQAFKDNLHTV